MRLMQQLFLIREGVKNAWLYMGHVPYHGGLTPPGPLYKVDFFQSFSEGSKKETLVKKS